MENKVSLFLKLTGVIPVITLVVSLIVLLVGWFFQWEEPVQFSNAFFAAGAILIVLGFLSVSGGFAQRYGAMTLLGIVGILLIVISVLIA